MYRLLVGAVVVQCAVVGAQDFFDQRQQLQFAQDNLQEQIAALQRQWTVAQGTDLQTSIQNRQSDLFRQQQELRARLQQQLIANLRGRPFNFRRPGGRPDPEQQFQLIDQEQETFPEEQISRRPQFQQEQQFQEEQISRRPQFQQEQQFQGEQISRRPQFQQEQQFQEGQISRRPQFQQEQISRRPQFQQEQQFSEEQISSTPQFQERQQFPEEQISSRPQFQQEQQFQEEQISSTTQFQPEEVLSRRPEVQQPQQFREEEPISRRPAEQFPPEVTVARRPTGADQFLEADDDDDAQVGIAPQPQPQPEVPRTTAGSAQQVAAEQIVIPKVTLPLEPRAPPRRAPQFVPEFDVVFQTDGGGGGGAGPEVFVQQVIASPPCATQSGEAGFCKPLVKCITFYTELPELRRQPCRLQGNEFGVCCPSRKRAPAAAPGRNNGVLRAPPPPPVVIPPFTPQQLNHAANVALERIQERLQFVAQLFAQNVVVTVGSPAAWHQEFFQSTNTTLETGDQAQKNVEASVSLINEFNLSPDQGTFALPTFSVLNTVIADSCPQEGGCRAEKYRTVDGSCNNLANPRWGRVNTALQRVLPPKYGDGVNSPRSAGTDGRPLTSARVISTQFSSEADRPDENYTLMLMQWGQFLDHDLTHTPISRGQAGTGLSCCREGTIIAENIRHPDCFPIALPLNDHIFAPFAERCMEFVRSLPAPRPECNFGPREQMNQVSGYMDGSNIYGSSTATQRELRLGQGGRMRVQNVRGRALMPGNRGECQDRTQTMTCFKAGDSRVNEQVDLAVMHTIWMREHNRVADALSRANPRWSDEALYQEARRIVAAEMQHVTYNEFLPLILGRSYMDKFELTPKDAGFTRLYDETLNGGITNVFATAAFRFGHSLIQSTMKGYSRFGNVRENLVLHQNHFSPFVLYKDGAFDDLVRGLSTQTCQRFDRFFSKELTDHLFQGNLDFGLDLVALNIQRGRDHGLPPYNEWRQVCGLPKAASWESLADVMDPLAVATLKTLYSSVDEVDLFVGAVAERPIPGAVVGQTFVCLIGDQFARLKRGDRFFYEEGNQPSSFTQEQLDEIRKVSLARVLCDNSDDIAVMQPLAFLQASFANQRVACASESIPRVDLKAWSREVPRV